MKKRLVALGLLLALGGTAAAADTLQHYATASTKKEAKQLATVAARTTARTSARCFRPARQVDACEKVEDGFRCRADSSDSYSTCGRAGWVYDPSPSFSSIALTDRGWQTDSWRSNPWSAVNSSAVGSLYGRTTPSNAGPPPPPPFPN